MPKCKPENVYGPLAKSSKTTKYAQKYLKEYKKRYLEWPCHTKEIDILLIACTVEDFSIADSGRFTISWHKDGPSQSERECNDEKLFGPR